MTPYYWTVSAQILGPLRSTSSLYDYPRRGTAPHRTDLAEKLLPKTSQWPPPRTSLLFSGAPSLSSPPGCRCRSGSAPCVGIRCPLCSPPFLSGWLEQSTWQLCWEREVWCGLESSLSSVVGRSVTCRNWSKEEVKLHQVNLRVF